MTISASLRLWNPIPSGRGWRRSFFPMRTVYRETDPLFCRNDLDFVDICAPSGFHEDLVKTACRAGLHVLCEKPLVTSPGGLAMIDEANTLGRVVFTVNNWKHAPLWVKTSQLLSEGRIGICRVMSPSPCFDPPIRAAALRTGDDARRSQAGAFCWITGGTIST